jgi:hypothetical protein
MIFAVNFRCAYQIPRNAVVQRKTAGRKYVFINVLIIKAYEFVELVQRSPTDCGVCLSAIVKPR